MTQLEKARRGVITTEMAIAAGVENVEPEYIRQGVAAGTIVLPTLTVHCICFGVSYCK